MSQSNKPQKLCTNMTQAYKNCQIRHQRKPRSSKVTEALYLFETVMLFISGQMPDDLNTVSINSYVPSLRTTKVQNNDSLIINLYQNITLSFTSHLNETSSVETSLNIYPYEAAETFPNIHFNDSSSVEIPHPCRAVEASQNTFFFIHEGPAQNNDPLIINPCLNIASFFISYPNNFSSLDTPDPYNNTITSSNIYAYGTNEQSFMLPSPFRL
ncbi:17086_t:CDS:2 [Dentiscutata erythropus]|uniref:17086_t:CDS:1 n=1 Tax=Dentiscutata erythropus TaxID=1348616 RepID=A0A9N8VJF3_9GLOM|nr:17086_t:CDS:2 [Dentiscutata erythropus]